MLWRVRQHGFAARCRAMSTSAQQAATRRPFLLGLGAATATTAAATVTFSVTLWPLADLLGAPPLISMSLGAAASAEPALEALGRGDLKDVARLQALLDGGEDGKGGRIVSLTGSSQSRRSFLLSHAAAGRPVFYLTLREATSTHALLSTTAQQLNRRSAECRVPDLAVVACPDRCSSSTRRSAGWATSAPASACTGSCCRRVPLGGLYGGFVHLSPWDARSLLLQDLVAHDPAHVRAVNFSIVPQPPPLHPASAQHSQRALSLF